MTLALTSLAASVTQPRNAAVGLLLIVALTVSLTPGGQWSETVSSRRSDSTPTPSLVEMVGAFPEGSASVVINVGSSISPIEPLPHGLALIFEPIAHEGAAKQAKVNDGNVDGGQSLVVPAAVAATASIATMTVYNQDGVSSSLSDVKKTDREAWWSTNKERGDGKKVEVPVLSMLDVMAWVPTGVPIKTLKTDMQGFDFNAVASLPRHQLTRVDSIMTEVYLAAAPYSGVQNDFCRDWVPFIKSVGCTIQSIVEQCENKKLPGAEVAAFCREGGRRLGDCEADAFWSCK